MNFYRAQDQARKQTTLLVLLFSLAVLALVLLTNTVVAIFVWYVDPSVVMQGQAGFNEVGLLSKFWIVISGLGWAKFLWISGLVCGVIGIATVSKWMSLRSGGAAVAESLGGTRILSNTDHADEKQLLNVVEEMALASGVPVPPVYLLKQESGINAFAAGLTLKDAVIGVSAGSIQMLNREQLQGVIAHEFSHILNGDMRLNMRILAVLHGILMIGEAGRLFVDMGSYRSRRRYRSSSSLNKSASITMLFGLALVILGWIGQIFGALIKSAVSRQREFLADASAVQFTRNPEGIGGALRLIGGHTHHSFVNHHNAHELGHLFFSQAFTASWFATHPPLDDRIRAVLPHWKGDYLKPDPNRAVREPIDPMQHVKSSLSKAVPAAAFSAGASGVEASVDKQIPNASTDDFSLHNDFQIKTEWYLAPELIRLAREPLDAVALCLALLLDQNREVRAKQLQVLTEHSRHWHASVERVAKHIEALEIDAILPLIDLMMPALKSLSVQQYQGLRQLMPVLIRADGRVDLLEWVLFELVRQHGDRHFGLEKPKALKYKTPKSAQSLYRIVLSRIVYCGSVHGEEQSAAEEERAKAFAQASNAAGMYTARLLPLEQCSGTRFTRAIYELSRAYPLLKPRLLKGLVKAAKSDGHLNSHERALIATIALIWDCPVSGLQVEHFFN